jgi:hypothetical protein
MKYFIMMILPLLAQANSLSMTEFINALVQVESNGNSQAIGDNGKAYGILQIHDIMIQDYNRITGSNLKHDDAFHPDIAKRVARSILIHYSSKWPNVNARDLAFIWNAGPKGIRYSRDPNYGNQSVRNNLNNYWAKVQKQL